MKAKTKTELGWQNVPQAGSYTLNSAVIIADKPQRLKKIENNIKDKDKNKKKKKEDTKEENENKKANNMLPWPPGFTATRNKNGGNVRLKRINEK